MGTSICLVVPFNLGKLVWDPHLTMLRVFHLNVFDITEEKSIDQYNSIYLMVGFVTKIILLLSDDCENFLPHETSSNSNNVCLFLYCSACKHLSTLILFRTFAFHIASYYCNIYRPAFYLWTDYAPTFPQNNVCTHNFY